MIEIVNGKRYNTETATLIASDRYWDGSNWERSGRNMYLYKTPKGAFFVHHTTHWQGEVDYIKPISQEDAMAVYEQLRVQEVEYEVAFGVEPEDA